MKCLQCGTEFEAKRVTAKFDTDKCKLAYNRNKTNDTLSKDDTVKTVSVSKEPYKTIDEWIPVAKRNGMSSHEEASERAFAAILEAASHGRGLSPLDQTARWMFKGKWVTVTKNGFTIDEAQ